MQFGICPEGSEWGPVEGIDYEEFRSVGSRSIVQAYDGSMNHYDLFRTWQAQCQAFPQSYTRLMLGCAGPEPQRRNGAEWETAIAKLETDRLDASMCKPRGAMIYLGEQATEDEVAGISRALFRHKMVVV
jgi:hypothetical protein